MKRFFTTLIMSIIIILLIAVLGILGYLVWQEIDGEAVANIAQNFVSTVTSLGKDEENLSTPGIIDTTSSELEATPTSGDVNYDNVVVDNYFYDQLEEPSKIIYRALEANKENMKSGTYQINLGNTFTDILSSANGESLLGDYYQSAVETFIYDNPDVFYLDVNKMYLNIETTTKRNDVSYNVFINSGNQANYLDEAYNSEAQINQAIAQLESVRNQIIAQAQGSAYNQIKYVHDYIVDNTSYDSTISNPDIYNIYGTLIRKSSVCEGYAKSFKYLMDALDIPCVIVIGEATNSSGESESHAWNYVMLNNIWYAIDTTWDDPVVIGGGRPSSSAKTRYFLRGANTFNADHFPNGQFTQSGKTYEYPVLSQIDYSR
mgnify:FL=1